MSIDSPAEMKKAPLLDTYWLVVCIVSLVFWVEDAQAGRLSRVFEPESEIEDHLQKEIRQPHSMSMEHRDIMTTVFWIGERAKPKSGWSSNFDSAWDRHWKENFGGLDSPVFRKGFFPAKFKPKQNPFYVALPFNDISNPEYLDSCPILQVFRSNPISNSKSVCKNRWIEISHEGKKCYGQWQDVGPVFTNDYEYVFGGQEPRAHDKDMAGLDVSPSIRDYLGFRGSCRTSWRFVEEVDVPHGPWSVVITRL